MLPPPVIHHRVVILAAIELGISDSDIKHFGDILDLLPQPNHDQKESDERAHPLRADEDADTCRIWCCLVRLRWLQSGFDWVEADQVRSGDGHWVLPK